ncbi:MAG TPA: hypothetical protein VNV43_01435 [Candidatus Acidoferrales bacterium]|jgi:hypothetical protein|nr:hypothetical protein [Candidatus Acidoferrales bacterium]
MTAKAVIEEIKLLPRAEQSRVIRFAFELAREGRLGGKELAELAELAEKMAESRNPEEVQELREEIHRGSQL